MENSLNELMFNIETVDMLLRHGKSSEEVLSFMEPLNLSEDLLELLMGNRRLLNTLILRIRTHMMVNDNTNLNKLESQLTQFHNNGVSDLVQYLCNNLNDQEVELEENHVSDEVENTNHVSDEVENTNHEDLEEQELLEQYFSNCVSQSENSDDVIKSSQFYSSLSDWVQREYNNLEIPSKKSLKNFLTEKVGPSSKNSWSNVILL
jgi:hypothetical protein